MKFWLLIFMLFPSLAFGQISKPGVEASNAGTIIGHANTVNCDGTYSVCTMSGSVLTITSSGGSSSLV